MSDIEFDSENGGGQPIPISPTNVTYPEIESAYKLINDRLFGGELPPVLITLQRKEKRVAGYFSPRRFVSPIGQLTDELALNPSHLGHHNTLFGLQTIGHEMCHIWQFHFGNAPRKGYHNKEFAAKMESIGLMPSETGKPGGNKVGQKMDDYVIAGGPFEQLANDLIGSGFKFPWSERDHDEITMDLDRLYEAKNAAESAAKAPSKATSGPAHESSHDRPSSRPVSDGHSGLYSYADEYEMVDRLRGEDGVDPDVEDVEGGPPRAPRERRQREENPRDDTSSESFSDQGNPLGEFSGDPVEFNGRDFSIPSPNDSPDFDPSDTQRNGQFTDSLPQESAPPAPEPKQKSPGRIAFICPCKHRIWGKPSIFAFCGHCKNQYLPSTEE